MAFFDIGINVTLNLGDTLNRINQLKTAMTGISAAGAQGAAGVNAFKTAVDSTTVSTQPAYVGLNNMGKGVTDLGARFSATIAPMQTLTAHTNQLGLTTQNTLQRIQASGNALNQFSGQLGQTSTAMSNTERSGSRLAEVFRGNRGLVFGLSATIGTITGVIFELQLMDDANKQVAESEARLADLVAQGKQNSGEYGQALQALGKDKRFLEFATRNLALAFTNFIPDIILVANGVLQLTDRLKAARAPMQLAGSTATATGAEIRVMGIMAATSATPLGALGVAGRSAAVGMEQAAIGARVLGISLRSLLISTGIGAALVVLGLALQPVIEGFIKSREAAAESAGVISSSADSIGASAQGLEGHFNDVITAGDAAAQGISTSSSRMSKDFGTSADEMLDKINELATQLHQLPSQVAAGMAKVELINAENEKEALLNKIKNRPLTTEIGPLFTPIGKPTEEEQAKLDTLNEKIDISKQKIIDYGNVTVDAMTTAKTSMGGATLEAGNLALSVNSLNSAALRVQTPLLNLLNAQKNILQTGFPAETLKDVGRELVMERFKEDPSEQAAALIIYDAAWEAHDQLVKDSTKSTKDAAAAENEINQMWAKNDAQLAELNAEYHKIADEINTVNTAFGTHFNIVSMDEAQRKKLLDLAMQQLFAYQAEEDALAGIAAKYGLLNPQIAEMIINKKDDVTALNLLIAASLDYTKALTDVDYNQRLVAEGTRMGIVSAREFIDTTIQNGAAQRQYGESLQAAMNMIKVSSNTTLGQLVPANIKLTNDEMNTLVESALVTGNAFETLANIVNERLAPAFETFSGITAGMTDEEFRKAFKEIEFGDINKEAWKDLKNMAKDMEDVATEGQEMLNIINALTIGVNNDSLKNSTIRQMLDEFGESLQRVIEIDPDGESLSWFPKFLEDLDKEDREALIIAHGDALTYLATALVDKDLRPEEVLAFMEKLGLTMDTTAGHASTLQDELDTLRGDIADFKAFQSGEFEPFTGMDWEAVQSGSGETDKDKKPPGKDQDKDVQQLVNDLEKVVPVAAQKSQTALANLAQQGSLSLAMLAKASSGNAQGISNNLNVVVLAAGKAALSLAQLMDAGTKAMALLVKGIKPHITTLDTYFGTTVYTAVNNALASIIALQAEGTKQMATMVKNFRPHVITLDTYFGTTIPQAVDESISAFNKMGSAASDLESDLASLESQAKQTAAALKKIPGGGGGGIREERAQHGFHGNVSQPTLFLAGEAGEERVDISPIGQTEGSVRRRNGGGDTTINLTVVTHNELDGERIGTTVTRKTFRKLNTR